MKRSATKRNGLVPYGGKVSWKHPCPLYFDLVCANSLTPANLTHRFSRVQGIAVVYAVQRSLPQKVRRTMKVSHRTLGLALLLCAGVSHSVAQNTTGTITGRLTDPSGAVVHDGQVTVKNAGTGELRNLKTSGAGEFTASLLLPGTYVVTAVASGFQTEVLNGVTIQVDQTVRTDMALKIGSSGETVEVSGNELTLDTDSATIGTTVDQKQVSELPLNGRSFVSLLFLEPGAVQTGGEQSSFRYGVGDAISIGGGASASNSYTLDGTTITDTSYVTPAFNISIEAVQEFKAQTKNYTAEYGFGANQINLSTRSGTNKFHGSVFEFIRNTAVDARDYFTRPPLQSAPLKQNQFGYALGGPVWIPHVYNGRDKTFFFANYEGLRIRSQQTLTGFMPTTDELNGTFQVSTFNTVSAAPTIIDPYTGIAFPKNANGAFVIPSSRFSKLGKLAASKLFAAPNVSGNAAYNYATNAPFDVTADQQTYRIDQVLGRTDSLFVRGTLADVFVLNPALTSYSATQQRQVSRNYQVTETHVFSPNLLNQLRVGYLEAQVLRLGALIADGDRTALGFNNIFQMPTANYPVLGLGTGLSQTATGSATQSLSGVGGPANLPTGSLQPAWDLSDSASYNHGAHSLGAGFTWRSLQLDRQSTVNPEGNFSFNGTLSHNQIADLLLGTPVSAQVAQPGPISDVQTGNSVHLHFKAWSPYITDNWRVTTRLTLNLGVRYDFSTVPYEEQNHLAWFNPAGNGSLFLANQNVAQNFGGSLYTYDGRRGPGPAQKNVLAPRFGFSFSPLSNGSMVLRGGYGIFYDSFQTNEFVSSTAVYPFAPTSVYSQTAGAVSFNTDTLFPPLTVGAATTATFANSLLQIAAPRKLNPYLQDFSLGVEQQLGPKTLVTAEYVGNKGTHLNIRTNANQPVQCTLAIGCDPNNSANGLKVNQVARRTYKNFGQMIIEDWSGYSNYNALNLKVQRRAKDLTLTFGYTWSKMMDIKSAAAAVTGDAGGAFGFQNFRCPSCDYSRSSYDVGQRVVAAFLYNLPFGEGQPLGNTSNAFVRKLIGGWQVNGIGSVQGGFPFSIAGSDPLNVNESSSQRANQVGNPYPAGFVKNIDHWFNTAAFANAPSGSYGNTSRNVLRGPGVQQFDASVFKTTRFEHFDIQLRFESFNVLNHPVFSTPNSTVTSTASFGTISATNSKVPNRQNQAAIKIQF